MLKNNLEYQLELDKQRTKIRKAYEAPTWIKATGVKPPVIFYAQAKSNGSKINEFA